MLFPLCNFPVNFNWDIDKIEDVVMERYNCYFRKPPSHISQEHDTLGHFVMCLLASRSTLLHEVVLKGECRLFLDKFDEVDIDEIKNQFSSCEKFLSIFDQIEPDPSIETSLQKNKNLIMNILKEFHYKTDHIFCGDHKEDCKKYKMCLPFQFTLDLVASRTVDIIKGNVEVFCGQWKNILKEIYVHILKFEVEFLRGFNLLQHLIFHTEDDRLKRIINNCVSYMTGRFSLKYDKISSDAIDNISQYFSPCMANLHHILRQKHRLSYDSRYQYMLFLKDIGMSVEECLKFWRNEYTVPYESSACIHYWHENSSRYEYQINHLYGLCGSKISKSSHSCAKFTGKLTLRMDGGCPFVHMSNDDLHQTLPKTLSEGDIEDILSYKACNKPQLACAVYVQALKKSFGRTSIISNKHLTEVLSPFHYYKIIRAVHF